MNRRNMLSIHVTDVCNSKCNFCIVDAPYMETNTVKKENIFKYLEQNKGAGFEAVNIHGGEPTIRSDFIEILEKVRDCGYPEVILQTNGRRLAKKEFAEQTANLNVVEYVVSLHGMDEETNTAITKAKGSFTQAVTGIENVKNLGRKVRSNSVISKDNLPYFDQLVDLIISLGVDHINISALHTAGTAFRNFDEVTPHYDDLVELIPRIINAANKAGTRITLEGFPLCVIKGHEKYTINWEEDKFKMLYREIVIPDYGRFMDQTARIKGEVCRSCEHSNACGGVYKEYIQYRGWSEFEKYRDAVAALS